MLSHRDGTRNTFTHTHAKTITQRWFCTEQLCAQIPLQTEALLRRNGFTRGAFIYGCFTQAYFCMISDGGPASRAASRCKTAITPQFLVIETHFMGKSWPSASLHWNFIWIFGDRHFVRAGCVSWTCSCWCPPASSQLPLLIYQLSGVSLGSWSPPAPMYLPH